MKHFRSVVSLLMVFVLCFGMIPRFCGGNHHTNSATVWRGFCF